MKASTIFLIVTLGATFGGFCLIGAFHLIDTTVAAKIFSIG